MGSYEHEFKMDMGRIGGSVCAHCGRSEDGIGFGPCCARLENALYDTEKSLREATKQLDQEIHARLQCADKLAEERESLREAVEESKTIKAWAQAQHDADGEALREAQEQLKGANCPSCGFPGFTADRIIAVRERAEAAEARSKHWEDSSKQHCEAATNWHGKFKASEDRANMLAEDMRRCDHHRQGCKEQALAAQVHAMREALGKCLEYSRAGSPNGCDCLESPKCAGKCHQSWLTKVLALPISAAERRVAALERVAISGQAVRRRYIKDVRIGPFMDEEWNALAEDLNALAALEKEGADA